MATTLVLTLRCTMDTMVKLAALSLNPVSSHLAKDLRVSSFSQRMDAGPLFIEADIFDLGSFFCWNLKLVDLISFDLQVTTNNVPLASPLRHRMELVLFTVCLCLLEAFLFSDDVL